MMRLLMHPFHTCVGTRLAVQWLGGVLRSGKFGVEIQETLATMDSIRMPLNFYFAAM
jgi:hypothetical protein